MSTNSTAADGKQRAYDAACKNILSLKYVLSHIMKDCLDDFAGTERSVIENRYIIDKPDVSKDAVHPNISPLITPAEDVSAEEGSVFFDVKFMASTPKSGEHVGLIINVEAQDKFSPGYPLLSRGVYYACRLISSQFGSFLKKADYGELVHAVSIWVCTKPTKKYENTITRFSLTPEQLFGRAMYKRKEYDLITIVMICLGETEEYDDDTPPAVQLVGRLLSKKETAEQKIEFLKKNFSDFPFDSITMKELNEMCSLGMGIYNDGVAAGEAGGFIRGRKEGLREGRKKGLMEGRKKGLMEGRKKGLMEGQKKGRKEGHETGVLSTLFELVSKNLLSVKDAAAQAKLGEAEFLNKMCVFGV